MNEKNTPNEKKTSYEKKPSKKKKTVGAFDYVFTSYEKLTEKRRESAISALLYRASVSRGWAAIRRRFARSSERSFILSAVRRFAYALPSVTLRAYGTFIFALGFYSALVCVIKAIASTLVTDTDALVFGGVLILASVPLLLSGKTLSDAVLESRLGSFIAFDLLGYRRETALSKKRIIKRCDISMIVGMAFGLLSFYIDIERITAGIIAVLAVYLIMSSPEGGAVLLVALAPVLPEKISVIYIAVLATGYLFKLLIGKRTFKLDLADSVMLVFALVVTFGDTVHYGNGTPELFGSHFVYILAYFLTVNLVKGEKWQKSCLGAASFGGVMTAFLAVAEMYLYGRISQLEFESGTLENVRDTFMTLMETSESAVLYIVAVFPILLSAVAGRRRESEKGISHNGAGAAALCAALVFVAAIVSGSRSLWLGMAVGFSVLLAFVNIRYIAIPAAVASAVPLAILILPDRLDVYIKRLFDLSGEGSLANVGVRENSVRMFLDNIVGGIGGADGVFSSYYGPYTGTGVTPDSAKNLFLGVGVSYGITGLVIFVTALIFLGIKIYTRARSSEPGEAKAVLAGLISFAFVGLTLDFFADPKLFLLFFIYSAFASSYTSVKPTRESTGRVLHVSSEKIATKDIEFE